jgi:predicted trehalose synthase
MGDWDTKPEPYPEHDTDRRRERNECKRDIVGVLGGYDAAVQAAVLSELLSTRVEHQAEEQFAREWSEDD